MAGLLEQASHIASVLRLVPKQQQQQQQRTESNKRREMMPTLLDFTADIDFALMNAEGAFRSFTEATKQRETAAAGAAAARQRRQGSALNPPGKDEQHHDSSMLVPVPPNLSRYLVDTTSASCTLLCGIAEKQMPYLDELRFILEKLQVPVQTSSSASSSAPAAVANQQSHRTTTTTTTRETASTASSYHHHHRQDEQEQETLPSQFLHHPPSREEYETLLVEARRQRDEYFRELQEQKRRQLEQQMQLDEDDERKMQELVAIAQRRELQEREQRWNERMKTMKMEQEAEKKEQKEQEEVEHENVLRRRAAEAEAEAEAEVAAATTAAARKNQKQSSSLTSFSIREIFGKNRNNSSRNSKDHAVVAASVAAGGGGYSSRWQAANHRDPSIALPATSLSGVDNNQSSAASLTHRTSLSHSIASSSAAAASSVHLRRLVWQRVCELDYILQLSNKYHSSSLGHLTVGIASSFLRLPNVKRNNHDDDENNLLYDDDRTFLVDSVLLLGGDDSEDDDDDPSSSLPFAAKAEAYLSSSAVPDEVLDVVVALVLDAAVPLTAIQLLVYTKDFIILREERSKRGKTAAATAAAAGVGASEEPSSVPPLLAAAAATSATRSNRGGCGGTELSDAERYQNWRRVLHFAREALLLLPPQRQPQPQRQNQQQTSLASCLARILDLLALAEGSASVSSALSHMELSREQRQHLILKRACEFLKAVNNLLRKLVPLTVMKRTSERLHTQSARDQQPQFQQQQQQQHQQQQSWHSQDSSMHRHQRRQHAIPVFLQRSASFHRSSVNTKRSMASVPSSTWTAMDRGLCAWVNSLGVLPHLANRRVDATKKSHEGQDDPSFSPLPSSSSSTLLLQPPSLRLPFATLLEPPIAVRAAYISPFACCASAEHCAHVSHNCDAVYKQHYHHRSSQQQYHHHPHQNPLIASLRGNSGGGSDHYSSSRENSIVSAAGGAGRRSASVESVHGSQHIFNTSTVTAAAATSLPTAAAAATGSSSLFIEQHRSLQDPDIFPFLTNGTVLCNIINVGLGVVDDLRRMNNSASSRSNNSNNNNTTSNQRRSASASSSATSSRLSVPLLKVYDNPRTMAHCKSNVDAALHFLSHTQRLSSSKFGLELLSDSAPILNGDFPAIVCVLEALRLWWNVIAAQTTALSAATTTTITTTMPAASLFWGPRAAEDVLVEARRSLNRALCGGGPSLRSGAADVVELRKNFDWVGNLLYRSSSSSPASVSSSFESERQPQQQESSIAPAVAAVSMNSPQALSMIVQQQHQQQQRRSASESVAVSFLSPVAVVVNSPIHPAPAKTESHRDNFALSQEALSTSAVNAQLSFN